MRGRDPTDDRNLPYTVDERAAKGFYQQDKADAERLRAGEA